MRDDDEIPGATTKHQRMLVSQMYREVLSPPVLENPESPVFHYTSVSSFENILSSKVIWATDYRELKDTREFAIGDEMFLEAAKAGAADAGLSADVRRFLGAVVENYEHLSYTKLLGPVFVASFCEWGDDVSQWREYAGKGDGVCFGINWRPSDTILESNHRIGATMLKVHYDRAELSRRMTERLVDVGEKCIRYLTTYPDDAEVLGSHGLLIAFRSLAYVIPAIKLQSYQGEAERRIIAVPRDGMPPEAIRRRKDGRCYLEVPLTPDVRTPIALHCVITGWADDAEKRLSDVQGVLRRHGYPEELARRSEIRER